MLGESERETIFYRLLPFHGGHDSNIGLGDSRCPVNHVALVCDDKQFRVGLVPRFLKLTQTV